MSEEIQVSLSTKLSKIQNNLSVPKERNNDFAHFKYRSCEDILEAVKPLLNGLVLTLSDEIQQIGDRYYIKAKATLSDDNTTISVVAYARESESKAGMDSAQVTGSTSSYARKYALNGLFCIDDTQDPDISDNRAVNTTTKIATTKIAPSPVKPAPIAPRPTPKPIIVNSSEDVIKHLDGELPTNAIGNTYCAICGKTVTPKIANYSLDKYKKVLCMADQLKEGSKSKE